MADEPEEKGKPEEEGADTTDWKAMARKWEARPKESADKARAYDELQEQSKTELQRVQEQAAAYKRQVEDLNAKAELDRARARVAKESGVPAELILGADEGEMEANAKALAAWGKPSSAPRTSRPGRFSADAGDGRDAAKRDRPAAVRLRRVGRALATQIGAENGRNEHIEDRPARRGRAGHPAQGAEQLHHPGALQELLEGEAGWRVRCQAPGNQHVGKVLQP